MSEDERIVAARAELEEHRSIAHRMAERREERKAIAAKLAAARTARAYEREDVERLTKGVGGAVRRLFAERATLPREEQELHEASALCLSLEQQLAVVNADLADLARRAAQFSRAEAQWNALVSVLADEARARGEKVAELDALFAAERELRVARGKIDEAIGLGVAAHRCAEPLLESLSPTPAELGDEYETAIFDYVTDLLPGSTWLLHRVHRKRVTATLQGAQRFHHACADLLAPGSPGVSIALPRIGGVGAFLARDLADLQRLKREELFAEISQLLDALFDCVVALRGYAFRLAADAEQLLLRREALVT